MLEQSLDGRSIAGNRVKQSQTLFCRNAEYASATKEPPVCPALKRAEEKSLVTDNRSTQRSAELVLEAERGRRDKALVEIAARIQMVVVVKNKNRTVQPIRSTAGDHVDHPTGGAAIFCRK